VAGCRVGIDHRISIEIEVRIQLPVHRLDEQSVGTLSGSNLIFKTIRVHFKFPDRLVFKYLCIAVYPALGDSPPGIIDRIFVFHSRGFWQARLQLDV
jgi:hypothetical protein